ncbi:MAG: hypothetical protein B6I38_08385 [Anaerolineaceae bacterium 4572_5.1]|nr:MAG: hypothetical protein B6I38_08385 [Anaerolineaceae bacterium 4572_5.1]
MHLKHLLKTTHQLGFTQVALFALYKLGLKTGYYKRIPIPDSQIANIEYLFSLPSSNELKETLGSDGIKTLLTEANHVVDGKFRIFGGELTEIKLDFDTPRSHWTDYETGKASIPNSQFPILSLNLPPSTLDLKLIWEPARFGWAFTLGRAYRVSGDEKYAEAFWRYFEIFDAGNPVNMGPNWMNGQEVAIRLMAFVWAAQIFDESNETTKERKERLTQSITQHATRITPTLLYARSQNNNHLPSEAAGLYTASLALPAHPQAPKWRKLGIKWLNWSFENQIDEKGEYIQHSVTYHRLVLQLALWVNALNTKSTKEHEEKIKKKEKKLSEPLCPSCLKKIALATRWLAELTDPISGNAPNLGANDGAYIFPLTNGDFRDFRPVVNAASRAFLNEDPFSIDEMSSWFKVESSKLKEKKPSTLNLKLSTLKPSTESWASLRIVNGNLRLAHADQLHLDLWWQGENITLDPGTYLYNAEAPWDNPLPAAEFHNTVTVNGQDQMTRASKFMYLDWSVGQVVERSDSGIIAEHDGYRKQGVTHRRTISFEKNTWHVEDNLKPSTLNLQTYRLHWLIPDWKYELESREERVEISLKSPHGLIRITSHATRNTQHATHSFSLARAGKLLHGAAEISPTRGWYSPTYGVKIPALSLALEVSASNEVQFTTKFLIPDS